MTYVIEGAIILYSINILYWFVSGLARLWCITCVSCDLQKEQEGVLPSDLDRLDVEETTGLDEAIPALVGYWLGFTDQYDTPVEIDYEYGGSCALDVEVLTDKLYESWGLSNDIIIPDCVRYDIPLSGLEFSSLKKERHQWQLA